MKKLMSILFVLGLCMGTSFGQSTVAYVNSQEVLDTMPSREKAMNEINRFQESALEELQETQSELQAEYSKLQNNKNEMSPTAFRFEQERLMKKSQDFQSRQRELDQQIQTLSQELNAPILERVQKAVEEVCKAKKIDYAIDSSALLYHGGGINITNAVISKVLEMENSESSTTNE